MMGFMFQNAGGGGDGFEAKGEASLTDGQAATAVIDMAVDSSAEVEALFWVAVALSSSAGNKKWTGFLHCHYQSSAWEVHPSTFEGDAGAYSWLAFTESSGEIALELLQSLGGTGFDGKIRWKKLPL